MNEIWELFIKARTSKVAYPKQEEQLIIDQYIESFHQLLPLTIEQKETMEQILLLLFSEQKSFHNFYPYLAFLFPMEQIEKSQKFYRELLPLFSTQSVSSQGEKILQCFKNNDISNDIIQHINQYSHSKEAYIWVLGFSYIYNETPDFAPLYRQKILTRYKDLFSTTHMKLPKKWFLTDDLQALKTYEFLENELETNSLLRLAFLFSFNEIHDNLSTFLQGVERFYDEIKTLFTLLFNHVKKGESSCEQLV